MVEIGHAVERQVVQVAQAHALERAQRVALLGEEQVVGLDALERNHQQRIVRKEVDEERVGLRLDGADQSGADGPALDHEDDAGAPRKAHTLEPLADPALVRSFGAAILVERILAAVCERPYLVTESVQLVAEIHAHVTWALERQDDQPPHGRERSTLAARAILPSP